MNEELGDLLLSLPDEQKAGLIDNYLNDPESSLCKSETVSPFLANQSEINKAKIFNCTDLGNAKRLVLQHGGMIRCCYAWKKWLIWNGKTWSIDDNGQILRLAKDTVRLIYREVYLISGLNKGS